VAETHACAGSVPLAFEAPVDGFWSLEDHAGVLMLMMGIWGIGKPGIPESGNPESGDPESGDPESGTPESGALEPPPQPSSTRQAGKANR
jgi:hypothetical protein